MRRGRFNESLDLGMKALATDINPTVARTRLLTGISRLELFTGHYDSARGARESGACNTGVRG
jgi:hypothetical protein